MTTRVHVFVSGRVQGVFFRFEVKRLAHRLNVTGWVKNRSDGRVEAIFEGEKEDVEKMVEFCRRGPPGARVTGVEVKWEVSTRGFKEFDVHYDY